MQTTVDTQLFFSFCPSDFDVNISLLQNALQQISSLMTATLVTLNSAEEKTEWANQDVKYDFTADLTGTGDRLSLIHI